MLPGFSTSGSRRILSPIVNPLPDPSCLTPFLLLLEEKDLGGRREGERLS